MRIAIVGAGLRGLSAARLLSEDPRHVLCVFETRTRFGAHAEASLDRLSRLGVSLRHTAQVERLAVDDAGADLWVNGLPERFDLALVATSAPEAAALLARSGIRRAGGSAPLGTRVYFAEPGRAADAAQAALIRMAHDHAVIRPRPGSLQPPRVADILRARAPRAAARVRYLDLSGVSWPLDAPAVYIANRRWALDVVPRHAMVRDLRTPDASDTTNAAAGHLEAGVSVAFVVESGSPPGGHAARAASQGRGAALAALAANAPVVPVAAQAPRRRRLARPWSRPCVVIGEPFYPETSSIEELLDDMRKIVRHLELHAGRRHAPLAGAVGTLPVDP
jgi:hypothetical protein